MSVRQVLVTLLVVGLAFAPVAMAKHAKTQAPPPLAFGAPVHVDATRFAGEPGIKADPLGRALYVDAPSGLSTGHQGWLWRSTDGGASWSFIQNVDGLRLSPELGGGDSDLAVTPSGRLYYADLWLGDISVARSDDLGLTWTQGTPVASDLPSTDRQWLGTLGENVVFLAFNQIPYGPTVSRSNDGGITWVTVPAIGTNQSTGYIGNLLVDSTGFVHVAYQVCDPQCSNEIWLTTSTDGGLTWTQTMIYHTDAGNVANLFSPIAEDRAGNLYAAWSEQLAPGQGSVVMVASSTDHGLTWSAPTVVSGSLNNAVMPWLVAGSDGRVDLVFYGTAYAGDAASAPTSAQWFVYFAQSLDAHAATPAWTLARTSDVPNHVGSICNQGTACDTNVPKGDRSLLDYFQVALDPSGRALIVYGDNHDLHSVPTLTSGDCWPSCRPYVTFVAQTSGPLAYAP
jgi:hypothetical protein